MSNNGMETEFEMKWRIGARTAALIVSRAARFSSIIELTHDNLKINGKSMMQIMLLDLKVGAQIRLTINGQDEVAAMKDLTGLFTYGPRLDRCPREGCDAIPILLEYGENGTTYICAHGHTWEMSGWPDKPEMANPEGRGSWS